MACGVMCPAAAVDGCRRSVAAWRLSDTRDGAFRRDMRDEALGQRTPEVSDTGQGVQFTAGAWVAWVAAARARVSMDGRRRRLDNVFAERLWRTVKYEGVFLRGYESVPELEKGSKAYFTFYDEGRLHRSLGYETPAEVYRAESSKELAKV